MDRVFTQEQRAVAEINHVAIAICAVPSTSEQRHIGILHKESDSSDVKLLHLGWHYDLRDNTPGSHYLWVDPAIPTPRLRQVAARCRQVFRANPNSIPYAFSPSNDCFDDQTSKFLLGPTRHGLTCATFVLAVFETAGLRLAKHETWPDERAGDHEWQESIIADLENGTPPASPEHIAAIRDEVGSVRIRPEEVAGAATVSELPADFNIAAERADEILQRL